MVDLTSNRTLRRIYGRWPALQPVLREVNGLIARRDPPTFVGWLMTTWHQVPWAPGWDEFRVAAAELRRFEHSQLAADDVDALLWRHWHVAYAVRHVVRHAAPASFTAAECGVGDGLTAHIALSQMRAEVDGEYLLHLFDAWAPMRAEGLTASEAPNVGTYDALQVDRTKRNLSRHDGRVQWHPGYIPQTLGDDAPEQVHWLHIDLNSSLATTQALEFFWPRLADGAVVLFDDYGWRHYADTKTAVDDFFASRPGSLMPLPTGQALYFR
jgi:phage tail protein X